MLAYVTSGMETYNRPKFFSAKERRRNAEHADSNLLRVRSVEPQET